MSASRSAIALALLLCGSAAADDRPAAGLKAAKVEPTPGCSGTVSGPAKGAFACRIDVRVRGDGSMRVFLAPARVPRGLRALLPGELEVPAPAQPGVYDLSRLTSARVLLTDARHRTFVAEAVKAKAGRPASRRGEVELRIDAVRAAEGAPVGGHPGSAAALSGSLRARLVAADGKGRDAVVDVKF
jgi:hypothetical protein